MTDAHISHCFTYGGKVALVHSDETGVLMWALDCVGDPGYWVNAFEKKVDSEKFAVENGLEIVVEGTAMPHDDKSFTRASARQSLVDSRNKLKDMFKYILATYLEAGGVEDVNARYLFDEIVVDCEGFIGRCKGATDGKEGDGR